MTFPSEVHFYLQFNISLYKINFKFLTYTLLLN
nr:MAG TPA: hypothetical protein [Caudoviricetes sp.]